MHEDGKDWTIGLVVGRKNKKLSEDSRKLR